MDANPFFPQSWLRFALWTPFYNGRSLAVGWAPQELIGRMDWTNQILSVFKNFA